jgi:hypothetical protein
MVRELKAAPPGRLSILAKGQTLQVVGCVFCAGPRSNAILTLRKYCSMRRFALSPEPWSVHRGQSTPSDEPTSFGLIDPTIRADSVISNRIGQREVLGAKLGMLGPHDRLDPFLRLVSIQKDGIERAWHEDCCDTVL